ncbi:MAG TPA: 50S ribosomal protein L19 [Vicinamibacteria bacterium]|jgi:large subunit ribosomal protein L19
MNVIDKLDASELKSDIPEFRSGDTVKVHVRVKEGDKERVQVFEGTVIALKGTGARATMTVRKTSFGTGVERIFPLHARTIDKIEVVRSHHVRRAKLYFMRERKGKAARLREKRTS